MKYLAGELVWVAFIALLGFTAWLDHQSETRCIDRGGKVDECRKAFLRMGCSSQDGK